MARAGIAANVGAVSECKRQREVNEAPYTVRLTPPLLRILSRAKGCAHLIARERLELNPNRANSVPNTPRPAVERRFGGRLTSLHVPVSRRARVRLSALRRPARRAPAKSFWRAGF